VLFQYFEKAMVPNMVLHRRRAMPEATRRATLKQELIRRMVNTSEMVSNERRVEIVNKYAEKLMNSEYPLDQTRNIIIGGLKGYELLLSLSMDMKNPKWKPLNMAAGWNARKRRIAKQSELEPPPRTSIHLEDASIPDSEEEEAETLPSETIQQEDQSIHEEEADLRPVGTRPEGQQLPKQVILQA
jgi:hypothetical protein